MMGCGKTTIAKLLIEKLSGFSLIDTDSLIVDNEQITINEIFSLKGEEYFRNLESNILFSVLEKDNQVISTGGGIVKLEKNRVLLNDKSIVVYLETSSDILFNRVKNNSERPLLNCSDMKSKIENLLVERIPLYKQAHIIINTDNKNPDKIVDEIINELKNYVAS